MPAPQDRIKYFIQKGRIIEGKTNKMAYSQFNIESIKNTFGITISEKLGIYDNIPDVNYSILLAETLQYNIPLALAITSEKACFEMIVTPILTVIRADKLIFGERV